MKIAITKLTVMLSLLLGLVSCHTTDDPYYYTPSWNYNCYGVYDYWGYYLYDECYWEYYNTDGTIQEKDMVSEVADQEAVLLEKLTGIYAEKFSLSNDAAAKVAKNVKDFSALKERTAEDIADFAQRLYGVNPSEIVSAFSDAQVGDNSNLDTVIEKASKNLGTSNAQTRALINELHSKALEASGIQL